MSEKMEGQDLVLGRREIKTVPERQVRKLRLTYLKKLFILSSKYNEK
jgi:hypothetical protein